jgi:hypothetical protein
MTVFKKKIKKDKSIPEYGTFKYAFRTGTTSPIEFYHQRLEYLKNKKELKRQARQLRKERNKQKQNGWWKSKFRRNKN